MASSSRIRRACNVRHEDPILPSLSEDIIIEILCRLPVKDIMRFKCVSKPWLAMILQIVTQFVLKHLSHSTSNPVLILEASESSYTVPNLHILERNDTNYPFSSVQIQCKKEKIFTLANSCRGLLCLLTLDWVLGPVVIWNPVTLDFIVLPNDRISLNIIEQQYVVGGFGFDLSSNTYKVVRIFEDVNEGLEGRLHIVGTDSWKAIGHLEDTFIYSEHGYDRTLLVEGTLYWLVLYGVEKIMMLLSFDLSVEKFDLIDVPPFFNRAPCLGLADLSGKPAIYSFNGVVFQVSMLLENNDVRCSWGEIFIIPSVPTCDPEDPIGIYSVPGRIRGTLKDEVYVVDVSNRLGAYNRRNNSWEFIGFISQTRNLTYSTLCHVESLIDPSTLVPPNAQSTLVQPNAQSSG